jgi:hypothetical protein
MGPRFRLKDKQDEKRSFLGATDPCNEESRINDQPTQVAVTIFAIVEDICSYLYGGFQLEIWLSMRRYRSLETRRNKCDMHKAVTG